MKRDIVALVVVSLIVILLLCSNIKLYVYQVQVQMYFNNWEDNPYNAETHNCVDMSVEVEEYWETIKHFDCFIVYGYNGKTAHAWNIVKIDDMYYEFDPTILMFADNSDEYDIILIQNGFYINGVKYNKSQPLDNWEEILK